MFAVLGFLPLDPFHFQKCSLGGNGTQHKRHSKSPLPSRDQSRLMIGTSANVSRLDKSVSMVPAVVRGDPHPRNAFSESEPVRGAVSECS